MMTNKKFFVQDCWNECADKTFKSLKKACEYAVQMYMQTGNRYLIHIGWFNLADTYGQSAEQLKVECREILATL